MNDQKYAGFDCLNQGICEKQIFIVLGPVKVQIFLTKKAENISNT